MKNSREKLQLEQLKSSRFKKALRYSGAILLTTLALSGFMARNQSKETSYVNDSNPIEYEHHGGTSINVSPDETGRIPFYRRENDGEIAMTTDSTRREADELRQSKDSQF